MWSPLYLNSEHINLPQGLVKVYTLQTSLCNGLMLLTVDPYHISYQDDSCQNAADLTDFLPPKTYVQHAPHHHLKHLPARDEKK